MIEPRSANQSPSSLVLVRVAVLIALTFSAALYMQYLAPGEASFCGLRSGCEAVRKAGLSYFFESRFISMPLAGLVAFGTAFVLALRAPRSKPTLSVLVAGGGFGAALIGVQAFYVHAFCWLCSVVDGAAIVAALLALWDFRNPLPRDPMPAWAWVSLAGLALSAPAGWVAVKPSPPVPPAITALYEPGKINVVEFADFECPFCRAFHSVLQDVIHDYPAGEVHFVRKHVPLHAHEQARPAARADICAAEQGKGDALADELVKIDLSPSAIRRAAVEVGVDPQEYDRCVASAATDARIEADTNLLVSVGMEGLPTTYVGNKRLLGAVSEAAVRDAFERAKKGAGRGGLSAPVYALAVAAAAAGIVWLGRRARGTVRDG